MLSLQFADGPRGIKIPKIKDIEDLKELSDIVHADPCWVARNMYGLDPWRGSKDEPGQAEILEAIFQDRCSKLCVTSGHAVGKTHISGVIPNMWFDANPWSHVIVTGASWIAVRRKLIPNIRLFARKQEVLRPTTDWKGVEWVVDDNWSLIGISPSEGEVGQGWHSVGRPEFGILSGTLVLSDESSNLAYKVHNGLTSLVTSEADCYFLFGNPIAVEGPFADTIRNPADWRLMRIDSRYNPNFRQRKVIIPGLATVKMIEDYEKKYGADSVEFGIRVAGQLPGQGENTLIAMSALERARDREPTPFDQDAPYVISVDVARSLVGDESVILLRGQTTIHYAEAGVGWRESVLTERVRRLYSKYPDKIQEVAIDAIGVGSGAADNLEDMGLPVHRVLFSERAHNAAEYANCRAESWALMGAAIENYLVIPPTVPGPDGKPVRLYDKLTQACTVEYDRKNKDRITLETKEHYKQRTLQSSPDWPDALAISFARSIGDPAFPMLQMHHLRSFTPIISRASYDKWKWHLQGMPESSDEKGILVRLVWLAPSSTSCCLWVFIDGDGCWYIYDCLLAKETVTQEFWRRVSSKSYGQAYEFDLVSGPEDPTGTAQYHTINTLSDLDPNCSPSWVCANDISGRKGLDYLEALLLSTLARAPEDAYWKGGPLFVDSDAYLRPEQIFFFNREAFDSAFASRRKPRPQRGEGYDEDMPEGLISDGGPVVRCLRMLAIKGGAYVI